MEFLQYVIRRKDFDDKRYRLIQCADLTVRQIQLDKRGNDSWSDEHLLRTEL